MSGMRSELTDVRVVWKFTVPAPGPTGRSWIDAPADAKLLSAGMQGDEMVVWALVDPEDQEPGLFRLIVANTGMTVPGFPEGARFLGSLTHNEVVWHVWDGDSETTA